MGRIISFFRESFEEMKKVVWPSREILLRHTMIVLATVIISMLIIAAIDFGLSKLVELMIERA